MLHPVAARSLPHAHRPTAAPPLTSAPGLCPRSGWLPPPAPPLSAITCGRCRCRCATPCVAQLYSCAHMCRQDAGRQHAVCASPLHPHVASPQQFLVPPVTNGLAVALSSMVRRWGGRPGRRGGAWDACDWDALQGAPPTSSPALPPQDPTATSADALAAQMMQQLSYSYDGNRAPMQIAIHTPWCVGRAGWGDLPAVGRFPAPRHTALPHHAASFTPPAGSPAAPTTWRP